MIGLVIYFVLIALCIALVTMLVRFVVAWIRLSIALKKEQNELLREIIKKMDNK